ARGLLKKGGESAKAVPPASTTAPKSPVTGAPVAKAGTKLPVPTATAGKVPTAPVPAMSKPSFKPPAAKPEAAAAVAKKNIDPDVLELGSEPAQPADEILLNLLEDHSQSAKLESKPEPRAMRATPQMPAAGKEPFGALAMSPVS